MKKYIFLGFAALIVFFLFLLLVVNGNKKPTHITVYGNVDVRQVNLGFRVFGRVVSMPYEEGDIVKQGSLVASLEKKPYIDQVAEAEATIASIEASLSNAEKILARRYELIASGSISQEDLETVYSNYEVFKANLEQAKAALLIAKKNVEDTEVFAPTDGTILTRIREPGSIVNTGDSVYTLSIASPVWVRAFIHEPDLGRVFPGMEAEIHTDTPGGKVYKGTVGFISPVSEFTPKTVQTTELRTDLVYRIRVNALHPDLGLRQGMPVTVKLKLKTLGEGT